MRLTAELVRFLFNYNPSTGVLTSRNKINKLSRVKIGKQVGCISSNGYRVVSIKSKNYGIHRIIWLYVYGYLPKEIDHINHVRDDNSINNLREVTHKKNQANKSKMKNNTSGMNGVSWCKTGRKWRARINVDGKKVNLGSYVNFSDAVNARKNGEVLYGYHENHGAQS